MSKSRHRWPRHIGLLLCLALVAGCTATIGGQAVKVASASGTSSTQTTDTTPSGLRPGVAPAQLKVTGDADTQWDTLAKDTIADLYTFYTAQFPKDFDKTFTPATALLSYSSDDKTASVCGRSLYQEVNASYNGAGCDTIVWDRGELLPAITKQVGELAVPTVLSHEMGHLVQNRLGVSEETPTIVLEQQADCYAGAYWHWVAEGNSKYFTLNKDNGIRQNLTALLSFADPVGSTMTSNQSHGNGFDRTLAFSLGYGAGPVRCNQINAAEVNTRIAESGFTVLPTDFGNVPVTDSLIQTVTATANTYFGQTIKGYKPPTLAPYSLAADSSLPAVTSTATARGTAATSEASAVPTLPSEQGPACSGNATSYPVSYCAATNTVNYDLAALKVVGTPEAGFDSHNGDFSAVLLVISRYALAAQSTGGAAATGDQAGLRALCYAGSWASWLRRPQGPQKIELSPGDLDKAVYEVLASPVPASDSNGSTSTSVFDQVQAFYVGVVYSETRCYDFYSG